MNHTKIMDLIIDKLDDKGQVKIYIVNSKNIEPYLHLYDPNLVSIVIKAEFSSETPYGVFEIPRYKLISIYDSGFNFKKYKLKKVDQKNVLNIVNSALKDNVQATNLFNINKLDLLLDIKPLLDKQSKSINFTPQSPIAKKSKENILCFHDKIMITTNFSAFTLDLNNKISKGKCCLVPIEHFKYFSENVKIEIGTTIITSSKMLVIPNTNHNIINTAILDSKTKVEKVKDVTKWISEINNEKVHWNPKLTNLIVKPINTKVEHFYINKVLVHTKFKYNKKMNYLLAPQKIKT